MFAALGLYHAGRLSSYALIGWLVGWIGSIPGWELAGRDVRGGLSLAAGAVLLAAAIGLPLLPRVAKGWPVVRITSYNVCYTKLLR